MAKIYDYYYGTIYTENIVLSGGQMDGLVINPKELILGEEHFVQFTDGSVGTYVFEGDMDKWGRRVMVLRSVEE